MDGDVTRGADVYRDLVNTPAFFELLPDVDVVALAAPEVAAHPEVADTRIVPYFLVVRARRP